MLNKNFKRLIIKVKSIKFLDWILIGFSFLSVLIFSILFFRKSSYIIATVKVGENLVFYDSWLSGSLFWNDASGTKNWFAETFHKGQVEQNGLGQIQASVLDVYSYDKSPTRKSVYLLVKLKVVYNRASNTNTYKGVPVLVGSQIKLNLDNVYANGIITNVQGFPNHEPREEIIVQAQIREESQTFLETAGTKSYVADALNIGDEVKDNNGNILIRILDKKVFPAKKTVVTNDGKVFENLDPSKKDVFLTLQINAQKIGGKYFFLDDIPILIDQIIPINTQTISVFPVVTKFLSVD